MVVAKSRMMRWAGNPARTEEKRDTHRYLVGKTERKRSLGRPRRRWENDCKFFVEK
jgi:hypothetical protein